MKRILILAVWVLLAAAIPGVSQGGDADGDGLDAAQEALLGTSPGLADTDGDGVGDGEEYWTWFTDPLKPDTDEDGFEDGSDPFPTWINYVDLNGVTTQTDRILNSPEAMTLNQLVQVSVGNVITIDWYNHLSPAYSLSSAEFTISFDFIDPNQADFEDEGFYRVDEDGEHVDVRIPGSRLLVEETTDWRPNTMTIGDWPYHLFSKRLEIGQRWDFNVFYHEFLPQQEDPYFEGHAEVVRIESVPIDTLLGRRNYDVYVVEATLRHATFNDLFFKNFLGEDPVLRTFVQVTVDRGVIVRFTTPFFRITPSKQVGFSDFIVNH